MKSSVVYGYVFTPAARTLDLANIPGFDIRKLYAVINTSRNGALIYATGIPGLNFSSLTGTVLTLQYNTTSHNAADLLQIIYDDDAQIVQTIVQNELNVIPARHFDVPPLLGDGDHSQLMIDKYGNLKTTGDGRPLLIANLDDIQFPDVQPVTGNKVNNESIGANLGKIPLSSTLIGASDEDTNIRPLRSNNDGNLMAVVQNFPNYITDAQLRAAPVPVSGSFFQALQPVNQTQVGGSAVSLGRKSAALSIPHVMANEDILDQVITGAGPNLPAINVNVLNAVTGTAAIDCQQYRSISFQVNCAGAVNAVTVNFEGSNDNVNFVPVSMLDVNAPTVAPVTTYATAAGVNRFWSGPIAFRYFRVRLSAAITGGTVQAFTILRMTPWSNPFQYLPTTQNLQTITTVSSVGSAGLATLTQTPIASAALTTTSTSGSQAATSLGSMVIEASVTVVSGTNPTLDISIEETYDAGASWFKVYDFERITATGQYRSPILSLGGIAYRIVRTVGGTTPSFTMSMISQSRTQIDLKNKRLIDRSILPNTLNSTTPILDVRDCTKLSIYQLSNAGASVAPVLTLQGSLDNIVWFDIPCTLTCTASSNTFNTINNPGFAYVRLNVSTAGTGAVLNYVSITAQK